MIIHHYTQSKLYFEILESGILLPNSTKSAIAAIPYLGKLLPKSHKQMGIYGILDNDIEKWENDQFAVNRLLKHKAKKEDLLKISFEIPDNSKVEVLDESILIHKLFNLPKKYNFDNISTLRKAIAIPKLGYQGIKLYNEFVKSSVELSQYTNEHQLPSVFIQDTIKLEDTLIKFEIIDFQEEFKHL
jgi:hypothetical protein